MSKDMYVCPECGMTVPADQMVLRPMLKPATIRQSPNDPVEVESLLPRVCQQCHDKMDTEKRR